MISKEKKWYFCPYCRKKLVIHYKDAKCTGVIIRCKSCKRDVEIVLNRAMSHASTKNLEELRRE